MPALPRTPQNLAGWMNVATAKAKRQGALSGVTQGAESAGKSGYNSVKSATSSLSTGQIVGAIIAIVVGFLLICLMLWYLCIRRLRSRREGTNYDSAPMTTSKEMRNSNISSPTHTAPDRDRRRTAMVPYETSYDFSKVGRGSRLGLASGGGARGRTESSEHLTSNAV